MNPNAILSMLMNSSPQIRSNPVLSNAIDMYQRGDNQGLRKLCENVCNERGIDLNQFANNIVNQFK